MTLLNADCWTLDKSLNPSGDHHILISQVSRGQNPTVRDLRQCIDRALPTQREWTSGTVVYTGPYKNRIVMKCTHSRK